MDAHHTPPMILLADDATGLTLSLDDAVGVLTYDAPGAPVNTLNSRIRPTLERMFAVIESHPSITSLVIFSAKADSWIAGADLDELSHVTTAQEGTELSHAGQMLLDRLAVLRVPTIAAIHGAALGGGLEVALACSHRIVTDHPKSILALPEVQLGLLPAAGGTQRLPQLVGLQQALDMILTGKNIRARKAWQMGLVDELVHPAILRSVAMTRARQLGRGETFTRRKRAHGAAAVLLEDNALGRKLVFRQAREQVLRKTKGKYPAPIAALETVQRGYTDGFAAGLRDEAEQFGALCVTPECRQLVSIFFATTALKKDNGLPDGRRAAPREIRKLGILGAGFMGAGIASVAVQSGTLVRMKDESPERLAAGWRAIREVVRERLTRKQISRLAMQDMLSQVGLTTDYSGFASAQLVIEAVFEDLDVKRRVLADIERVAPGAIFASNTSTIPIREIAAGARHPERVVGMHFFSPVHKMPLLEVIVTPETSDEATASVVSYGRALGKTVIVVRDGPGFYVNRILAPYINEAGALLDEGVSIEAIDAAMTSFGFPVGPITLLDEVGLDIAGKSGPIMAAAFGARMQPSAVLGRVIASGRLGRKSRRGFYRYDENSKRLGVDEGIYALSASGTTRRVMDGDRLQRRMVLPMLNEAVRCLEDDIIRSPRDGDIGAVFGIGFPPFLGGPFRHLDTLGAETVVRQLDELESEFPGRFAAASRLRAMAAHGTRFHP
jgi:3-hydroxyacyl-CoA dehydrogenase/enoyl-CoA hydratase/3-hydroxybutyryl-CoA epimerase